MGSITVPDRTLQRQKKPSVALVFCKLRPSFSLSRQRFVGLLFVRATGETKRSIANPPDCERRTKR